MGSQDEEDPKEIENPGQGVQEIPASWCIFSDKEIQHSQDDCVAAEHVISTGVDASQGHTKTTPNGKGPV